MIDLRRALPIVGIALALLSVAFPAAAAPKDAEAQELVKKAIYTDYLGTKFADAEKKLRQALALCEPEAACSAPVRARIRCDLGVVYVGGMNRVDDGKEQFAEAVRQDPAVAPDKDLVSPEIEAAFAEVKRAPGDRKPAPPKPEPTAPAPAAGGGDLVHTPPPEQAALTPLPIYAELPKGVAASRVQLSYKPFGAGEWKTLEMKVVDKGYGVEVPCAEIGSTFGDFAYFVQAFDGTNNLVSWSGARGTPNKVAIRMSIEGAAPHLPGQPPPSKCPELGDCPPEFPGCHDNDKNPPACEAGSPECSTPVAAAPARKNWISIAYQQDWLFLPGSNTTCAGGNGYDCFAGSNYYSTIPYAGSGDVVQGGPAAATGRVLLGYDRVIVAGLAIGARAGVAFRGGPTTPGYSPFLPVHAEVRAAYWLGRDPFARTGVRPYVVVAGGVAQVDASVEVKLYKTADDYASNTVDHYQAWRKTGLGFVGAGAGLGLSVAPRHVIFLEGKFVELLGLPGSSLNLQLGYALGL